MRKLFLLLLSSVAVFGLTVVLADSSYSEYISVIKENSDIDFSMIDEEDVFIVEQWLSYTGLEKGTEAGEIVVIIPSEGTDDLYCSYFKDGEYVETYMDFSIIEPIYGQLKNFMKNAPEYISQNGLYNTGKVKDLLMFDVGVHSYDFYCEDVRYIIPFATLPDSTFDYINGEDYNFELGKAYTIDEFITMCADSRAAYKEYIRELNSENKITYPAIALNQDGEVVEVESASVVKTSKSETDETKDIQKNTNETVKKSEETLSDNDEKDTEDEAVVKSEDKTETVDITNENERYAEGETSEESITTVTDISFTDVPESHWAYSAITAFAKEKVILGYVNGYYGVNDLVTHEQLGLLLGRQFGYEKPDKQAYPALREEIIVSLVKALNADVTQAEISVINERFTDGDVISEENQKYIAYAIETGLVIGYNGCLNTDSYVTRAETAVLLHRAMNLAK